MNPILQFFTDFQVIPNFGTQLDFLGEFARAIIEGVGIIGVGIIVFTLVLKGITLPFDIYQRYKTRKQTLIMRNMKEDLDKLQKQYANDKNTYNMKMQELYKKNGYSMLGACLPMLISLVILIVAFQGFNSYSRFAKAQIFVNMSEAYNAEILKGGVSGIDYALELEADGTKYVLVNPADETDRHEIQLGNEETMSWSADGIDYQVEYTAEKELYLAVSPEDGSGKYLRYQYFLGNFVDSENGTVFAPAEEIKKEYKLDIETFYTVLDETDTAQKKVKDDINGVLASEEFSDTEKATKITALCKDYLVTVGAEKAAEYYRENSPGFLWVKNVWSPDVSYQHPVAATSEIEGLSNEQYANLTSALTEEKEAANGYYILIILSIGAMLLSQFITMRSQKETNQYQTVDGQGAKTQKIMLFVMPLIFAVFAFFYSAAFSIYMIMSSLITLAVTLLCNLVLGRIFRKKEENAIKAQYGREVPWKQKKENGKKRK